MHEAVDVAGRRGGLDPRRSRTSLMLALVASAATAAAAAATTSSTSDHRHGPGSKPHLFLMVVDDLGWNNVGWHNKEMLTPHADKLCAEGVELDRNYVFMYCSPTRSSILSGRLPFHVNQINLGNANVGEGIPKEMTIIARKLKIAGYKTHMVGKWHCGAADWAQIPMSKGFDTSLHYFAGAEDHWTQGSCVDQLCNAPDPEKQHRHTVDLWNTNQPAWGMNNTRYGGYLYNERVLETIDSHDPSQPLFFYIAFQQNHEPLEAPTEFIDRYSSSYNVDRRRYAAMTTFWDSSIGNITSALRRKNMFNDTLIVLSGDNGGPVYWSLSDYPHGAGANNYPLFGGKVSNWEGGIRVAGFVSGGALPQAARGTKLEQLIHGCDWYATFCTLAGVPKADPSAVAAGFADVDSLSMWQLLTGDVKVSPRTEIPAAIEFENTNAAVNVTAIIDSQGWKLVLGQQYQCFWQGPDFPNASAGVPYGDWYNTSCSCGSYEMGGCLFNVFHDPTEHNNLAKTDPATAAPHLARLKARYVELKKTRRDQSALINGSTAEHAKYALQVAKNKGFAGPFIGIPSAHNI